MKKVISAMLIMGMILCLGGCRDSAPSDAMAELYENDEKLGSIYSSYSMSDFWEEIDGNDISGGYKDLNGMVTLWLYEGEGGIALDIDYSVKVLDGKVKLIMVDTQGAVTTVAEFPTGSASDEMQTTTFSLQDKRYCLKLVGTNDADVEFVIEVKDGQFIGVE